MNTRIALLTVFLLITSCSSTALTIESDTIDPPSYEHNQTLDHLFNSVDLTGISGDGQPDTLYFTFPDTVRLDPRNVTSNATVESGPELVDRDYDGLKESVKITLNEEGSENITAEATLNTAAWLQGHRDVTIRTIIYDSKYGKAEDNGTMVFEGSQLAFEHREENHNHQNDFSEARMEAPVCITGTGMIDRILKQLIKKF